MNYLLDSVFTFLPLIVTLAFVSIVLTIANHLLQRRWRNNPNAQFHFQLIMLVLTFAGMLTVIAALPINDTQRGQLLSLIGILLSAAIALSSTTFIGNIMAGIMLKVVRNARLGDFITVEDLTGRITEMDLLHTEIQTEFRDLVTVPNLYMVTRPLRVVRASGSIISADVSLGFDVHHGVACGVLRDAAAASGLKDCFVQVRELGDFSVTYRAAGLLEDIKSLISARSALRMAMLQGLHDAGIEIVSPTFMNTRALGKGEVVAPGETQTPAVDQDVTPEEIAFDKANDVASAERIRSVIERIDRDIAEESGSDDPASERRVARLTKRREHLAALLDTIQEDIRNKEFE